VNGFVGRVFVAVMLECITGGSSRKISLSHGRLMMLQTKINLVIYDVLSDNDYNLQTVKYNGI
jgi:hypothetical protein